MSGVKNTVYLDVVSNKNPFENITESFINKHHQLISARDNAAEYDNKSLALELSELSCGKICQTVVNESAKILRALPVLRHLVGPPLEHATQVDRLLAQQKAATSYHEWRATSLKLDKLLNNDAWKKKLHCTLYDYELVNTTLHQLRNARQAGDYKKLLYLIRTQVSRNMGNMGNTDLYRHSHVGTKVLIEEFIAECELCLETLARGETGLDDPFVLGTLIQTRKNVGRTALVLSGGATFGMLHIGVLATLLEEGLLPKIIAGSSAGAIVASILCSRTPEGLVDLMDLLTEKHFDVFGTGPENGFLNCVARFLKYGTYLDICYLQDTMQSFLGDLTFRECYNRTGRILNVTVSPASVHEQPTLLNYLTAPNVLIWSAVCASCSLPGVFASSTILEKNIKTNEIQEWSNPMIKFVDGSVHGDLPITRLSEMFNVDHIIACQVNPHIAPWLKVSIEGVGGEKENVILSKAKRLLNRTYNFWIDESTHYLEISSEIGIATNLCTKLISVLSQKYSGDITILPDLRVSEYAKVLKNPSPEFILDATARGARATWSKLSIINNHCAIEFGLDRAISTIRSRFILSRRTSLASSPVSLQNLHRQYLLSQKKKRQHSRRSSENFAVNSSPALRRVRSKVFSGRRNSDPENLVQAPSTRTTHSNSIPASMAATQPVSPLNTRRVSYFEESPTVRQGRNPDLVMRKITNYISRSPVPKVMMTGSPKRMRAHSLRDTEQNSPPKSRSRNFTLGSAVDLIQLTQGQIMGTMDDEFVSGDESRFDSSGTAVDQREYADETDQINMGFSYYNETGFDGDDELYGTPPNSKGSQ